MTARRLPTTARSIATCSRAYRMFAYDKGWLRRLEEAIDSWPRRRSGRGERSSPIARARMERDRRSPYLRERLHDLDDLANRLDAPSPWRGRGGTQEIPANAQSWSGAISAPRELMDHAGKYPRGLVLEEGSLSSHAAIVARALAMCRWWCSAERVTREANRGRSSWPSMGHRGPVHAPARAHGCCSAPFTRRVELERQAGARRSIARLTRQARHHPRTARP